MRPDVSPLFADRGIGGTGAPAALSAASRTADRGIGGTGIIGVVTGFGSIFVNGLEIQYPADVHFTLPSPCSAMALPCSVLPRNSAPVAVRL